jgi:serine/threonine protein kinase
MFSLGCVLLEVVVLHERGTLEHIRQNRSPDPSFHANLSTVSLWCAPLWSPQSVRRSNLVQEIRSLLERDPANRPNAKQLLIRITGYDLSALTTSNQSVFGNCCKNRFVAVEQCQADALLHKTEVESLQLELKRSNLRLEEQVKDRVSLIHQLEVANAELAAQKAGLTRNENIKIC